MNVCSWDWGAIAGFSGAAATLLAGGVALFISHKWREQKGSEVISNEAAKILVVLQDYSENIIVLHSLIMNPLANNNAARVQEFKNTANQLRSQSLLFSELVSDDKDMVLKIRSIAAKFYSETNSLNKMTFKQVINTPTSSTLVSRFDAEIKAPRATIINYFKHEK